MDDDLRRMLERAVDGLSAAIDLNPSRAYDLGITDVRHELTKTLASDSQSTTALDEVRRLRGLVDHWRDAYEKEFAHGKRKTACLEALREIHSDECCDIDMAAVRDIDAALGAKGGE